MHQESTEAGKQNAHPHAQTKINSGKHEEMCHRHLHPSSADGQFIPICIDLTAGTQVSASHDFTVGSRSL